MKNMTKEELIAKIETLEKHIETLEAKAGGRKLQVLKYLQEHGHVAVRDIAKHIGISERNVSSQMTYLRSDGYAIATDSRGLKFLE